jgi:hypothetical protein
MIVSSLALFRMLITIQKQDLPDPIGGPLTSAAFTMGRLAVRGDMTLVKASWSLVR